MYQTLPPERVPSSPISIQRLPSFRNFELPTLSFSRFASSRTLSNAYKAGDELERQALNNVDEGTLKWETEYNANAEEDPNLVSPIFRS
jgi:hypothetical protein